MNEIHKKPIRSLGYNFIDKRYIPDGQDEYYLRNQQNTNGIEYRNLTAYEIEVLVRNSNTSDDWNKIQVSNAFNPELVKNCSFFGLVRIGKLELMALEYHNVRMPVGLYNSTIISCDFGDNVVVNNVRYLSHYIIGSEAMIVNVDELHCTDHSKFGNGIIKEGEDEEVRIWMEVCNENGGRKILPFNGMLTGDAYLWARYRGDAVLMDRFKEFTEKKFNKLRGYYGKVGDRSVIKNTSIIKDVWVGSDAYIKGANKLKNLTIKSSADAPTQIGEGCELVNGIIDEGCRIFYGVKAVRFLMASHSQLKYGARLINSYLGNNSTISCCEVLNSLIYPAHEQHHNNSFLIAALLMGQSNIAAGATIGSNHNSRAADGEMLAGRGFWPALCVSLKHNSKFATFTLLARGDYGYELNIPMPFSLVSIHVPENKLLVMPGYWFMYNMYALARNAGKYVDRDKRTDFTQHIEYDFLAPDSVNEIFDALRILAVATARAYGHDGEEENLVAEGRKILEAPGKLEREITVKGFECHSRPVVILKAKEAYAIYTRMITYYGVQQLLTAAEAPPDKGESWLNQLPDASTRQPWTNVGGQLMPQAALHQLLDGIREGSINDWTGVHDFYRQQSAAYAGLKLQHALASLYELRGLDRKSLQGHLPQLWEEALETKKWMVNQIRNSRSKDYDNEYRSMMYENREEMEAVLGKLDDNSFILKQEAELRRMEARISKLKTKV